MSTTAQEIALMKKDIETLSEKVDKMDEKLDNLTKILLNPEKGFVVKVNKNTEFRLTYEQSLNKINELEIWKNTASKALWVIYMALAGGAIKILFFL